MKDIKDKDIKDFDATIKKLNVVINRIRKYNPNAILYATPNAINLLKDTSEINESEFVVSSQYVDYMDCGDW